MLAFKRMRAARLTSAARLADGRAVIENGFNFSAFYELLAQIVADRQTTWRLVALETEIPSVTLRRMAKGKCPDAGTLAVLSAWAGINPGDFVAISPNWTRSDTITQISSVLRSDSQIEDESLEDLETIIHLAYDRFKQGVGAAR